MFEDVSLGKNSSSEQSENPKKETPKKSTPESNKVEKATQEKPASLPDEMSQNTESEIQVEQVSLPENVNADSSSTDQEVEMDGFKVVRAAKTEKASDLFPERKGDYHFPTLELLMEPPDEESNEDEDHMIKAVIEMPYEEKKMESGECEGGKARRHSPVDAVTQDGVEVPEEDAAPESEAVAAAENRGKMKATQHIAPAQTWAI